eukprot:GHVR01082289.1.p1 GENE.GHVR01082289.1~~GHVR01082289.1.p1  ORF type:complete len:391 (-),score=69.09 GHVR01082289.1:410-1582(-)
MSDDRGAVMLVGLRASVDAALDMLTVHKEYIQKRADLQNEDKILRRDLQELKTKAGVIPPHRTDHSADDRRGVNRGPMPGGPRNVYRPPPDGQHRPPMHNQQVPQRTGDYPARGGERQPPHVYMPGGMPLTHPTLGTKLPGAMWEGPVVDSGYNYPPVDTSWDMGMRGGRGRGRGGRGGGRGGPVGMSGRNDFPDLKSAGNSHPAPAHLHSHTHDDVHGVDDNNAEGYKNNTNDTHTHRDLQSRRKPQRGNQSNDSHTVPQVYKKKATQPGNQQNTSSTQQQQTNNQGNIQNANLMYMPKTQQNQGTLGQSTATTGAPNLTSIESNDTDKNIKIENTNADGVDHDRSGEGNTNRSKGRGKKGFKNPRSDPHTNPTNEEQTPAVQETNVES